ncbi:MAG: GAF domain-containing protein [Chloroflexi bacterium]|nr:GAF domain-containing protein [Chloroflexota bacterium]
MASEKLTLKKYQAFVQERGQAVLDIMAAIATGNLEHIEVDIPPGDDILGDIAIGLSFILDDFRTLLGAQDAARLDLEQKVADRTAELESALAELQTTQRRYLRQEWGNYLQELDGQLDSSWELAPEMTPVLESAISHNRIATHTNGHSTLAVPISYADELIGVLGFSGNTEQQWAEEDLAAVTAIVEQVGLALENQRLFDQTQTALNESETLYNFSAWLNVATTLEEIVQAIASVSGAENAILFRMEGDAQRPPTQMIPVANWNSSGHETSTPLNVVNPISPVMQRVIQNPNEPQLFGNVATNPNFPEQARASYAAMKIASIAWLPLFANEHWLGAVGISWPDERLFGEVERRIYQAMMGQTAVALNQYLLSQEIRTRAQNLEKLAEIEGTLSQTNTPSELVAALGHGLNEPALTIAVHLLELDANKVPVSQTPVAIWSNGGLDTQDPRLGRVIPMNTLSTARFWLQNPNQLLYIEDVTTDSRVDEATRQTYANLNVRSTNIIPLRSGSMWQGVIALTSAKPYQFTPQQRFIVESLQDSLSAIVASQRAQLAQREALAETELLYRASLGFNRAENVDDVLRVVVETLEGTGAVSATMWNLEINEQTNTPITQTLLAAWRFDGGPSRMPLGTTVNLTEYPISKLWYERPQLVTLINDVATDRNLDKEPVVRQMLQAMGIQAQAFLPLTTGSRWVGLISVQWDSTYQFDAKDERLYTTLAAQAANSIDSLFLLENTRQQAQQLRLVAQIESSLSTAETEIDILQAVISALPEIDHGVLNFIETNAEGYPEFFDPQAEIIMGKLYAPPRTPRLDLREFPSTAIWIAQPQDMLVMEDVANDPRLDEASRAGLISLKWASYIFLPLFTGGRWQGVLAMAWRKSHLITETERFVLEQVMEPLAAVVASRRAFLEQQRAEAALRANTEQLEKLAVIQQQLSAAVNEQDVLQAVLGAVDHVSQLQGVTLGYINIDEQGNPTTINMVAAWEKGQMDGDHPILGHEFDLAYLPSAKGWIDNPGQLFIIEDIEQDIQLEGFAKQMFLQSGVYGVTTIPLRSGGRWQANLSYSWAAPHKLSASERFIMERLLESVGTTIASRRAFLAQQQAQQETERLYNASRRINEAAGDLPEIVAALGELNPSLSFNRGVFWLFDYVQSEIFHIRVEGNWYSGQGHYPTDTGTRYGRELFSKMGYLFTQEPLFLGRVDQQSDWSTEILADLQQSKIQTLVILPVWARGARQLGTIVLKGEQSQLFSEADTRPYISLLPQVAVAVENKLLLEQTSDRARREQVLREVTEKVRSSTDVATILKTATAEIGRALGRKAFITIDTTKR